MIKVIGILFVIGILAYLFKPVYAAEATDKFDSELSASGVTSFILSNSNGEVEILPSDGDKIIVHALKKVKGLTEGECKQLIENLKVIVTKTPTTVEVSQSKFHKLLYNESIEYTIHIPKTIELGIITANGAISCKEHTSDASFETSNGEIEITKFSGKLKVETSNGQINAECTTSNASFETSNGSMHLKVVLADSGKLTAETSNGAIHVQLPKTVSASVSAETSNGRISAGDFESTLSLNRQRTEMRGKLGSGTGTVELNTSNGRIVLDSF